jgi:hypothetical protein
LLTIAFIQANMELFTNDISPDEDVQRASGYRPGDWLEGTA